MTLMLAASPFILNSLMGMFKWMGAQDFSTPGKRMILALLSIVGVISTNALAHSALDMNSLSGLVQILLESFVAFIAAHGSYHFFWKSA